MSAAETTEPAQTTKPAQAGAGPLSDGTVPQRPASMPGPSTPGTAAPVQVSPAVYKRLTTGLGGFTMALIACFAFVGLIVLITPRSEKEVLPTVDYTVQMWTLRSTAPYTSYAPQGLPAGWRPTSSRLTGTPDKGPVAWHLGFLTPRGEYAALEESDENANAFIRRMANRDRPVGTQQVAGATWDRYVRPDKNQRTLVRRLKDVTLVVTGTASYDELAILAASLHPQPKAAVNPTPSHGG